jgi:hypothetical protein
LSATLSNPNKRPIHVPKAPYGKKKPNMFDGTDTPDKRDNFESLHQLEVGRLIRKSTKPRLSDNDIGPQFVKAEFNEQQDGPFLEKHFTYREHTPPEIKK